MLARGYIRCSWPEHSQDLLPQVRGYLLPQVRMQHARRRDTVTAGSTLGKGERHLQQLLGLGLPDVRAAWRLWRPLHMRGPGLFLAFRLLAETWVLVAPRSHRSEYQCSIDGAYFGTTFPHLMLMTYPSFRPPQSIEKYVPRVFGFKLHSSAYGNR